MTKAAKKKSAAVKPRKKMALGRGLDSLLPSLDTPAMPAAGENGGQGAAALNCDIALIRPNRYQPRQAFREEELAELAASIEAQGVLQPLLVRRAAHGYELVAGERRLRAAKLAGLTNVPVLVRDISDKEMLEISIVENIQRENLNPVEEAEAYHRLMTEFNLTQAVVSQRVGKSRSAVANFLRLRQLSAAIKESLTAGELSMGHARALLSLERRAQQNAAFRTVITKRLSVRETEALVKRLKAGPKASPPIVETSEERHLRATAEELSRHFGTKVQIRKKGDRGRVEIEFYSGEDLERLLGLLEPAG
ncbi:MAG: ParB/RepB/Spo0J family partition protein [Desulfosarcinaceae bacterium]|nr:ParB/RepB/Spo0J family partition protein [Desulfosarcinaceae bacterium]